MAYERLVTCMHEVAWPSFAKGRHDVILIQRDSVLLSSTINCNDEAVTWNTLMSCGH